MDGVLYGLTPTQKVFAVNAATGKLLWKFDSGIKGTQPDRGLAYWSDGQGESAFSLAVMNFVYALDAATGKPISNFRQRRPIDLREDLGRDPAEQVDLSHQSRRDLQRSDDRGRARVGDPAGILATSEPTTFVRVSCVGRSIRFPIPANSATTLGRRMPGSRSGAANNWTGMTLDRNTRNRLHPDRLGCV